MTKPPVFAVIGGVFALVIAMGIGRFAYTPILPLGTFIVSIAETIPGMKGAAKIHSDNSSRAIGFLTAVYALGQVIGPTAAGLLTTYTQHYQEALFGAAGFVVLGACLLWIGLQLEKKPGGGENRNRAVQ